MTTSILNSHGLTASVSSLAFSPFSLASERSYISDHAGNSGPYPPRGLARRGLSCNEPTIGEIAASFAQAPQHKPCRLLGDADLFRQLHRRDSLARRNQQVHGIEPLVQWNLRALHHCSGADCEVKGAHQAAIVAVLAGRAASQNTDTLTQQAHRADRAVWPDSIFEVDPRRLLIREQGKKLEGADGGAAHLFHPFPSPHVKGRRNTRFKRGEKAILGQVNVKHHI